MAIVVIPKELSKNQDLIAVPRNVYEEFLTWQKRIKSGRTFSPTSVDIQTLKRGRNNLEKGNYITLDELERNN